MLTRCTRCERALEPVPSQTADVTVGTVRGLREAPRAWVCPRGHETRVAEPDTVAEEVLGLLDVAVRPLLRRGLRCGGCGTELVLPGRRAMRSVTVTGAGVPATRLSFDLPLLRCPEDAVENLPPECVDDLREVITALFADDAHRR